MAPPKSDAWKYFNKISHDQVKCKICFKNLKFSSNTTNMLQHVRLKHSSEMHKNDGKSEKDDSVICKSQEDVKQTAKRNERQRYPAKLASSPRSIRTRSTQMRSRRKKDSSSPSTATSGSQTSLIIHNSSRSEDDASAPGRENSKPKVRSSSSQRSRTNLQKSKPLQTLNSQNTANSLNQFKQPSLENVFSNIKNYKAGGAKNSKTTQAIAEMIVIDNLPFTFVEGKGFKNFIKQHLPLYNVPTRNTVKAHIDKMYDVEVEKFKNVLKVLNHLCLTTDIWTDSQMNSMLGITVHGLNENKLISGTLGVFKLTEAHTAEYISEMLRSSLAEFYISSNNIAAVVTDNGANVVKAVVDTFGKHKHVPCFAHTLNLVCENSMGLDEVNQLIAKCRNVVVYVKRHVKANDDLRKAQSTAGVAEGKILKLLLDVKTRWNSTYYMLERFVKILPYVSQIMLNFNDAPPLVTSNEKEIIMEIISLLRPLEAMTVQLSAEKVATLCQIIPLVNCGREQLSKIYCEYDKSQKLKEKLLFEFDRRFACLENSFLLAASTILDPRFKKIHFRDPLAVSSALRRLRNEMDSAEDVESSSETSSSGDDGFDLWAPHKSLIHKKNKAKDVYSEDELTFYLNAPVVSLNKSTICAWNDMRNSYPKLYILSQKYCHLLGTSVPAERLFSKAGITATDRRNRLTTKRLSKLLFLNSWLDSNQFK